MPRPLPPELVRLLFKALLNDPSETGQTLTNALSVCSLWYGLGIAMRWKDVVVNNFKLSRFNAMSFKRPLLKQLDHIRSFTVRLSGNQELIMHDDIGNLAQCLCRMQYLTTLSLELRPSRDEALQTRCRHFGVLFGDLSFILSRLPKSVENLELTVSSHSLLGRKQSCAYCDTLREATASVKNFRYSGALCPSFFRDLAHHPQRKTESLVINMISLLRCMSREANLWQCCWQPWRALDNGVELATAARAALNLGKMPQIRRLEILSMLGDSTHSNNPRTELGIVHRNVIDNTAAVYPFISAQPYSWIRYQESPHHKMHEKVVKFDGVAIQIEGQNWIETTFGARYPADHKATSEGQSGGYRWLPAPNIKQIEYKCVKWDPAPALWKWEQEADCKLLLPQFKDHIGSVSPLRRETCEAERKGVRLSDCAMVIEYPELPGADNTDDSWVTGDSVGSSSGLQ